MFIENDLASCRLASRELAAQLAPLVFSDITIIFRYKTFTRQSRLASLGRIGHCIRSMSFKIPHTKETFLPPVIDPITGTERTFVYIPQRYQSSFRGLKYESPEMTD